MLESLNFLQIFRKHISTISWKTFKEELKTIKWKNPKALPNEAYNPTDVEQLANVITHAIWILPSLFAAKTLFQRSSNDAQKLSALIYGGTLVFLFIVSTSFHSVCFCKNRRNLRNVLHRCDRAIIYIFIAGSYFPWLSIHDVLSSVKWYVWIMACLGILYQQIFHEKYKTLEILFYVAMGVVPAATVLAEALLIPGMVEVIFGGCLYITGIIFFKSDGVIPFAHAIWHLFVVSAASVHYYAILNYLYPQDVYQNFERNEM